MSTIHKLALKGSLMGISQSTDMYSTHLDADSFNETI